MEAGAVEGTRSTLASPLPDAHGTSRWGTVHDADETSAPEAMDDVHDPTSGWPQPNVSENLGETANVDDHVPPEVIQELNRLKVLGRPYQAPSVDELAARELGTLMTMKVHCEVRKMHCS